MQRETFEAFYNSFNGQHNLYTGRLAGFMTSTLRELEKQARALEFE